MMNVLILSNSFPNRLQPHRGVYTEEIAVELKKKANITMNVLKPNITLTLRRPDIELEDIT